MSIIDLKVNKSMLDLQFESYKLSLDPIPVLQQPVIDGVDTKELKSKDYSYLHTRMSLLHNYLFQDPMCQNNVFYVNNKHKVLWTSLGEDERLTVSRCVWDIPAASANVTISFPGAEYAVLCCGDKELFILYTPSREAGEPWTCCHSYTIDVSTSCYVLHSVHRTLPGAQQIDCLIATVEDKSVLPESDILSNNSSFVFLLEWITFSCSQNNQVWTKKRSRKLAGTSFPEYAAIDTIGDAVCVVSQTEFKYIFDSEGLVSSRNNTDTASSQPPKYTYIQTPDDVTVYFRLPEGLKKSDIQITFFPRHMEVLIQGKCVLSGDLANCIDHESSTWILDGEKLEVILSKAESGLMWQELVKGDKDGEEVMDPELVTEVHSRLAYLTSETEHVPSDRVPFNLEQLEECDSSTEQLTFQRIDGNEHCETHKVNMAGHQWLFTGQICPESLPAICLRHDVDGILWQPKNIYSEGETEHFKMEHIATFSALGYVSASKQDKKFTFCSPDFQFAVITDCARHLYVYCQLEDLHSALELRNRRTGQSVAHIAKQYVVSLENCDRILGLQVSSQCIFVLSKDTLYAVKVISR